MFQNVNGRGPIIFHEKDWKEKFVDEYLKTNKCPKYNIF